MYRFNNLSYKLNFVSTYINVLKLIKIAFNNSTNFLFINLITMIKQNKLKVIPISTTHLQTNL